VASLPDKFVYSVAGLHFTRTLDIGESFFLQPLKNAVLSSTTNRIICFISFNLIIYMDDLQVGSPDYLTVRPVFQMLYQVFCTPVNKQGFCVSFIYL
jgi:hypothetical protein